jgi:hypothetical protein
MKLKYISAQPAIDYFAWQTEVYIRNFLEVGIAPEDIVVLGAYDVKPSDNWNRLVDEFPLVEFHFYKDTRVNRTYIPSIQSHILAKHFTKFRELKDYAFFFHDSDFIFSKKFDFTPFLNDDTWYFSDTISYLGANYIKSKSPELLDIMCNTVGISRELVEANQANAGGAQKLMKNLTPEYWAEVERNANAIYAIKNLDKYKTESDPYPIQIWCASMWSELWTSWKHGNEIRVPREFDFCWATDSIQRWHQVSFFHNAGVTSNDMDLFHKGSYINKLPYGENLNINPAKCSVLYYQEVRKTALVSPLK